MKFRKKHGGTLVLPGGRTIHPGEVFEAELSEVRAVMQSLEPLEELPVDVPEPIVSQYTVQRRCIGWYDVIDRYGKAVNEVALRKTEAEELIKTL